MKASRHRKIVELVNKYNIETQEELADKLIAVGFNVTQATVSRDIREIGLYKVNVDGKQKYTITQSREITVNSKYIRIFKDGCVSMDCAGNILVIKTVPGMAMAVGAALDAMHFKEIVGCIAGDDTIMCAIKHASETEHVMKNLESIILK